MVRETSIETYNYIRNSGLLSERRMQVYDCLYAGGKMTAGEIYEVIKIGRANANIAARLNELRKMKAVTEVGTKKCRSTGMTVILWATTNNLPEPYTKENKVTKKQLEAENAKLRECVEFYVIANDSGYKAEQTLKEINKG